MSRFIEFHGQNCIIAENQPPYAPIPCRVVGGPNGVVVACLKLDADELGDIVANGGVLWMQFLTLGQPFQPLAASPLPPVFEDTPDLPMFSPKMQDECPHGVKTTEHCPACQDEEPTGLIESDEKDMCSECGYFENKHAVWCNSSPVRVSLHLTRTGVTRGPEPVPCPDCGNVSKHAKHCKQVESGFDVK